jgi:hypothetical protein
VCSSADIRKRQFEGADRADDHHDVAGGGRGRERVARLYEHWAIRSALEVVVLSGVKGTLAVRSSGVTKSRRDAFSRHEGNCEQRRYEKDKRGGLGHGGALRRQCPMSKANCGLGPGGQQPGAYEYALD